MTLPTSNDVTPSGLRIEGAWENDRNTESADCFKAAIREAFNVQDVIIGHHLIYEARDKRADGFTYEVVQEIPSADAFIFDHDIARKLWGDKWQECLTRLALEPVTTRDKLFSTMYYGRAR
jgi:hypothetical protein